MAAEAIGLKEFSRRISSIGNDALLVKRIWKAKQYWDEIGREMDGPRAEWDADRVRTNINRPLCVPTAVGG